MTWRPAMTGIVACVLSATALAGRELHVSPVAVPGLADDLQFRTISDSATAAQPRSPQFLCAITDLATRMCRKSP